jgi:hypothetical protein
VINRCGGLPCIRSVRGYRNSLGSSGRIPPLLGAGRPGAESDSGKVSLWSKSLRRYGRHFIYKAAGVPALRGLALAAHNLLHRDRPWMRPHPFDQENGIDTGGFVPSRLMPTGHDADQHSTAYAGCQPSCLRAAISAIPTPDQTIFMDLGCGKGRALIVASEWPFRQILGVELSPRLARAAQKNAKIIAAAHLSGPAFQSR